MNLNKKKCTALMLALCSTGAMAEADPVVNMDLNKTTWGQNVLMYQWSKTSECDFFRQKEDNSWLTIQSGVTFGQSANGTAPLGTHTFRTKCYSSKNGERQFLFTGDKVYEVKTTGNLISFDVVPTGDKPVRICLNDGRFSSGSTYQIKTRNGDAFNVSLDTNTCFDKVYADLNPAWGIYAQDGFHYGDFVYDEGRYSATTYRGQTVGVNENEPVLTTEVNLGAANFLLTDGLMVDEDIADGEVYLVHGQIDASGNHKFEAFDSLGAPKVMQGSLLSSDGNTIDLSLLASGASLPEGKITLSLNNAKKGDVIKLFPFSGDF
jgi:hypothetical protein